MGASTSIQAASEDVANNNDEYKLTKLDVINMQSVLLGLHNSISELHKKHDDLNRLISVQNKLFKQQNDVIKSLVGVGTPEVVDQNGADEQPVDLNGTDEQPEPTTGRSTPESLPPLEEVSALAEGEAEENDAEEEHNESSAPMLDSYLADSIDAHYHQEHTFTIPAPPTTEDNGSLKSVPISEPKEKKSEEGNANSSSNDGLCRLFKLDITILLAKLSERTMEETIKELRKILSKGPVGAMDQYEMALDAILQCAFDEPSRCAIIARLIQRMTAGLSLKELTKLQRAFRSSLSKHITMCKDLEHSARALRKTGFTANRSQDELILTKYKIKCSQRNRLLYSISRLATELYKVKVLPAKSIMEVGDDLLRKAANGDDVAATCLHTLVRKLSNGFTETVLEQQWMEKVYHSMEAMIQNKQLSMATRLAFSELSELKHGPKCGVFDHA